MSLGTILVTGGSRGLGRATVEAALARGASVAFTYRSDSEAARSLEAGAPGRALALPMDLADPEAPARVVETVEARLGPIDGLVNNAGIRVESLLALTSDEDWRRVLDVNLDGPFRCCRAVMRGMISRRRGSIVNVSSLGAIHGVKGQTAYAASKAALLGLTRSLAREVGRKNIRVNAVAPGFVATEMTRDLPETAIAALRAAECLPGGVDARGVAETVLFLLSDGSASITGQCLVVDAGASA